MIASRDPENDALAGAAPWFAMVTPDVVAGEQYAARLRPFVRSPVLVVAVMADALLVCARYFRRPGARWRRELEEARNWFASEDGSWPFSFPSVCSALDLDPQAVRQALADLEDAEHHPGTKGDFGAIRTVFSVCG